MCPAPIIIIFTSYICVCLVKLKHVMEDCFTKSFYSVCVSEEKVKSEVNDHNM